MRGAEAVVRALEEAGVKHLFALSGNQIMPVLTPVNLYRLLNLASPHSREVSESF